MAFRLANTILNTVSYLSLYMLYGLSDEMWDVGNVVCQKWHIEHVGSWGCVNVRDVRYWEQGMLGICDVGGVGCQGCGILGMWDVRDVGCSRCSISRCGMFGMWDVQDVGCSEGEAFRVWNVRDVGCLACGMLGMSYVWDVGCSRCGMFGLQDVRYGKFAEMWDVYLQNAKYLEYPFIRGSFMHIYCIYLCIYLLH